MGRENIRGALYRDNILERRAQGFPEKEERIRKGPPLTLLI